MEDKKTVLIMEDDQDLRPALVRFLSRKFQVTAVANGEEGVRYLAEHEVDIVLSDMCMPFLSGPQAHAEARPNSYHHWVFMSGGCPDEFADYAQEHRLEVLNKGLSLVPAFFAWVKAQRE